MTHATAAVLVLLCLGESSAIGADKAASGPAQAVVSPAARTALRPRRQIQQFPADVKAAGDRLWSKASPAVRAWSSQNARGIAKGPGDPGELARAVALARWTNLRAPEAYDALTFILVYEAAKIEQDSLAQMGETESLRLQMAMERLSKMMSTLSNLLKKISDTASGVTQNLK